jgi:hypothetical protein
MTLDTALLEHAQTGRTRLLDAERDIAVARAEFDHAVRTLYAAGASLREIADALGLSHQRVHQIVDADPDASPGSRVERVLAAAAARGAKAGLLSRITATAREVVRLAEEQARTLGDQQITPVDFLLALSNRSAGVAGEVLAQLGVTGDAIRDALGDRPADSAAGKARRIGFSSSSKEALKRAWREASALDKPGIVDAGHILLGVVGVDDGEVDAILNKLGTTAEAVRNAALAALAGER